MRKKRKRNNRIQHLLKIICLELVVIVLLLLCFVYILPRNPVSEIILDFIEEKPLVVLDAGHGGYDVGSEFNGVYEKNITLEITKKVGEELERRDIPVTYTRDSDHVDWPSDELQDWKNVYIYQIQVELLYLYLSIQMRQKQKMGKDLKYGRKLVTNKQRNWQKT